MIVALKAETKVWVINILKRDYFITKYNCILLAPIIIDLNLIINKTRSTNLKHVD